MGIDYLIDLDCAPKRALTLPGLMGRLKGRERAAAIIDLYRRQGDQRPAAEMGFEMVRRLPDGSEETEIVRVQDLLDAARALEPWEAHCAGCPANVAGAPFGCVGSINYPISSAAERWLLNQLPDSAHPLPFLLLQSALRELRYTGEGVRDLRAQPGVYLEAPQALVRDFETLRINGDVVFDLLFLSGPILPAHGSVLLQFFGGISQDLDADVIMQLADPPSQAWIAEHIPFLLRPERTDDPSIAALKQFFAALYRAFGLRVAVLLDV